VVNPPPPKSAEEVDPKEDAVYTQRLEMPLGEGSILIKATDDVRPAALREARRIASLMLARGDPGVRRRIGASGLEIAIIPAFKKLTDLPEFRYLSGRRYGDGRLFDQVRGVTATASGRKPMIATSEENLLRLISTVQSTMHHEFGHAVLLLGVAKEDRPQWTKVYEAARSAKRFGNLYATSSEHEYFAELSQTFFDMAPYFCSRERLAALDPAAFEFLAKVYEAPVSQPSAGAAKDKASVPISSEKSR
jgi:hypothetical protein